jgi:hypothetical protein
MGYALNVYGTTTALARVKAARVFAQRIRLKTEGTVRHHSED